MTLDECSIEGCARPVKGRGYCGLHHKRFWLYGDPLATQRLTVEQRFWRDVEQMCSPLGIGPTQQLVGEAVCCVNPDHLEAVTQAENNRRAAAAQTHCINGHLYDEANTYLFRGYRQCKACNRANTRDRRAKARAER